MSERQVESVKIGIYNNRLSSLQFNVRGGRTGDHHVQWLQGEWRCDCQGWMAHSKCRHVKAGAILLKKVEEALDLIEQGEKENWKAYSLT